MGWVGVKTFCHLSCGEGAGDGWKISGENGGGVIKFFETQMKIYLIPTP